MADSFTDVLADKFTYHAVDVSRFEAHARTSTLQLLKDLEAKLVEDLNHFDPTTATMKVRRTEALLKSVRSNIQEAYSGIKRDHRASMIRLADTVSTSTIDVVNKAARVSLLNVGVPAETLKALTDNTIIQGAPTAEWWARQGGNLNQRFQNQIREGIYRGDPLDALINRVRGTRELNFKDGIMETSRREAAALVRTSVQSIHNAARLETLKENPDVIKGWQALAVLDDRTTELCMGRSGFAWYQDGTPMTEDTNIDFPGPPPRHFQCRTVLIPVTYSWAELAKNTDAGKKVQAAVEELPKSTQASMDGQVAGDLNYEDWLRTKPDAFQKEILGLPKWELWQSGQLSLKDMIDQQGRPLTIDQLTQRLTGTPPKLDDEDARLLQLIPAGIQSEVRILQELLAREAPGLFQEARVAGSWAKQEAKRLPDRLGPKTSNLNLLLVPREDPTLVPVARRRLRASQKEAAQRIQASLQASSQRTIDVTVYKPVGDPNRNKTLLAWKPKPTIEPPIEPPTPPKPKPTPPKPAPPAPPPPPVPPPPSAPPTPKPALRTPTPKPAPTADGPPWTPKTPGYEWHQAAMTTAPDYIKRAIKDLPPVRKVIYTVKGGKGASYNPGSWRINMAQHKTSSADSAHTWRHEYGHHVDRMLQVTRGSGNSIYLSQTRTWRAAREADGKAFLSANNGTVAADAAEARGRQLVDKFNDIVAYSGKDPAEQWYAERVAEAGLNYDDWIAMMREMLMFPSAQEGLQVLAGYEAGISTRAMQYLMRRGRTARMGQQWMDAVGATTKEKIGYGHGIKYYNEWDGAQGAEAFAQTFSALSHHNPMWGKWYERMLPNFTKLVKGALENVQPTL